MEPYQEKYFDEKFKTLGDKIEEYIKSQENKNCDMRSDIKDIKTDITNLSKYLWLAVGGLGVIVFILNMVG